MNRRTWTLIGGMVVLLGIGLVALGQFEGEQTVRYVEDIQAEPVAHQTGSYTLLGIPQPEQVPLTGPNGSYMAANANYAPVQTLHAWSDANGTLWHSTHTVHATPGEHAIGWRLENSTRAPYTGAALPTTNTTWQTAPGLAFPIEAFDDGDGHSPRIWAVLPGPASQPLQVKPSQFTGQLLTHDATGAPLPPGVLIWTVDEYVAGCSSKFLPPEQAANTTRA